jgi:hypothetical protein
MRTAFNEHGGKALWFLARRFGRAMCFMDMSSMACGYSSLPSLAFCFVLSLFVGHSVLLIKSIRYRCDMAMLREEWNM